MVTSSQQDILLFRWWILFLWVTRACYHPTNCEGPASTPFPSISLTTSFPEEKRGLTSKNPLLTFNCFTLVQDSSWTSALSYDASSALISLNLQHVGEACLDCLRGQVDLSFVYKVTLIRQWRSRDEDGRRRLVVSSSSSQYLTPRNLKTSASFEYVIFRGSYHLQLQVCQKSPEADLLDCDEGVNSKRIKVGSENEAHSCLGPPAADSDKELPQVLKTVLRPISSTIGFEFRYRPCMSRVFPYESVSLKLILLPPDEQDVCSLASSAAHLVLQQDLGVDLMADGNAHVVFETPVLDKGNRYCATVEHNHILCREEVEEDLTEEEHLLKKRSISGLAEEHPKLFRHLHKSHFSLQRLRRRRRRRRGGGRQEGLVERPEFCHMFSPVILVPPVDDSMPLIAKYIPFCTTHFKCGWLYILVVCGAAFLTSCLLAICCIYCCSKSVKRRIVLAGEDQRTFDTLCLQEDAATATGAEVFPIISSKKTWAEVHDEFDADPPKNPGKILLLYSPDSKQFKDLQKAFRNFLEMACHCVVLDLFDEQLFETICYDPEMWLSNLLKDKHFKIIVVCSEGAYKRQQALLKGEVLNIPHVGSSLDGLFSAGLKFIQEHHATDHKRLALIRYQSLALTKEEYRLSMTFVTTINKRRALGAGGEEILIPEGDISEAEKNSDKREFIVPSQLSDLFCWIHELDNNSLKGRPWENFHLELQLLQDELKQARRRSMTLR